MKRLFAVLAAILITAALAACSQSSDPPPATVPETQAPTDPPYIDTPIDEPEWTRYEGELTLEDAHNIYAEGDDFICFAIVGAEPKDMELRFRFDDVTAAMLKEQSPDNKYYITFNGENIGAATITKNGAEAVIKSADAKTEITYLATRIRGLR